MRRTTPLDHPPHATQLHRRIYAAMLWMAGIFIAGSWYGFAYSRYIDFLLFVATGLFVMAAALPLLIARQWRDHPTRGPHHRESETFHEWADGQFDTFTGATSGRGAAIEILLPLAAVAFGMVAFAILTHLMR
jgi:hypothetical protein